MRKVMVAVDGSAASLSAVRTAARSGSGDLAVRLELVNVQPRLHRHIADRVPAAWRREWRERRAREALGPAERAARQAGIEYGSHVVVGPVAARLLRCARDLRVDEIVMGSTRRGALGRWLANSVTSRVMEMSPVPVRVVPGERAPLLERIALPAGLGLVALLLLADE